MTSWTYCVSKNSTVTYYIQWVKTSRTYITVCHHILLIYILQCNVFFLILCCLWTICPCLVHVRFTSGCVFLWIRFYLEIGSGPGQSRSESAKYRIYCTLMAKKCCPIFVVVYFQEIVLYVQEILSNFYRTICVVKFASYTNY